MRRANSARSRHPRAPRSMDYFRLADHPGVIISQRQFRR
jgi:hypothetical protein